MISTTNYDYLPWASDSQIDFSDKNWKKLLGPVPERILKTLHDETKRGIVILPYPRLVFKAFELPLSEVQIVIIGQDPYFNIENSSTGILIPQAMGMSFSVPIGISIPSSLYNIYKNLYKYKHLKSIPTHGNLEKIACQGVLFLNSALTVQKGKANSHKTLWVEFTNKIIKALDSHTIVFVLWGSDAIKKSELISRGTIVASSHPSGLSCSKPCGKYPAFNDNDFAKDLGIDWNVLLR